MRRLLIASLALLLGVMPTMPVLATCGGGGGGGVGGAIAGGTSEPVTYQVPWTLVDRAQDRVGIKEGLALLWFPASPEEARASDLQTSRTLTLLSSQCVHPLIVTPDNAKLRQAKAVNGGPTVVLADATGQELGRVPEPDGKLRASEVEKLVRAEVDRISDELSERLDAAKDKVKVGEDDAAAALFAAVVEQGCLAPKVAKKAAKELKKLGREVPAQVGELQGDETRPFDLTRSTERRIVRAMTRGVLAERQNQLEAARGHYQRAARIDPSDPVPARFLAELHRHHTGDWQMAARLFRQLLDRPADAISRAVALHGLGKMTIHSGEFGEGLALFHRSLEAFPLPLTYRNLAVYWNSEGEHDKAYGYVQQAMELAPDDLYNQVFAATYLVERGDRAAALAIAHRHENFLEASYNLAAIHAQLGNRAEALELLHRHFYSYERYDDVRAKEMQEARDDIVFAHYHQDPEFIALTSLATTDPSSYHQELPAAIGGSR